MSGNSKTWLLIVFYKYVLGRVFDKLPISFYFSCNLLLFSFSKQTFVRFIVVFNNNNITRNKNIEASGSANI